MAYDQLEEVNKTIFGNTGGIELLKRKEKEMRGMHHDLNDQELEIVAFSINYMQLGMLQKDNSSS